MSVSIQEVTKTYGLQKAVDGISFAAAEGEILGFLGPNGAGKTTTMKMITCFMPPTSGRITVHNCDTQNQSVDARKKIGYLPEHNPLYYDMYVREYLDFVARLNRIPRTDRQARTDEMVELCGLSSEKHKKIGQLSKGYRQRVGLAQALMHDPPVLILDEPTSGLDPNQIVEIRSLIKRVGKKKTVILSTHILQEVQAICDRVVIINKGKIVADDTTHNLSHRASGEILIHLEIRPAGESTPDLNDLYSIPGVIRIELKNATNFIIRSAPGRDIREEIFRFCVGKNLTILSFYRETQSLEDIFRILTSDTPRRNDA